MPREPKTKEIEKAKRDLSSYLGTVFLCFLESEETDPLSKRNPLHLLVSFCKAQHYSLDYLIRLLDVSDQPDPEAWFRVINELERRIDTTPDIDFLVKLYLQADDETQVLGFLLCYFWFCQIRNETEKRIESQGTGNPYHEYLMRRDQNSLEALHKVIRPKDWYYEIYGETVAHRESVISLALLEFSAKHEVKTKIGDWAHIPHSVSSKPHPIKAKSWERVSPLFLGLRIKTALKKYHLLVSGEIDSLCLEVRTAFRTNYSERFGIDPRRYPTPKEVEIDDISTQTMRELGNKFNPEIVLGGKQERKREEDREFEIKNLIKQEFPDLFATMWEQAQGDEKNRINITEVALKMGKSRDQVNRQLQHIKKLAKKINKLGR